MKTLISAFVILLAPLALVAPSLKPQAESVRERELSRLDSSIVAGVYASLVRLRATLGAIAGSGGEMADDAAALAQKWDERLAGPVAGMADYLSAHMDNWTGRREALERRARQQAVAALADAQRRQETIDAAREAVGFRAATPTTEVALVFDSAFAADGLAQIHAGHVTTLRIDGSGGARGLIATAVIPRTWMMVRSYGDAAVVRARSLVGEGLSSITLSVVPLPEETRDRSLEVVRHRVTPGGVARFHDGAKLIEAGRVEAFGRDALYAVREEQLASRHGVVAGVVKEYLTVIGDNLVKIEAGVTDSGRPGAELLDMAALRAEFDRVEPLFDELLRRWSPDASSSRPSSP